MNNLAEYFHRSGQFYYILFDLKGNCKYVNPLFHKEFSHICPDFCDHKFADCIAEGEVEKFKTVVEESLRNPDEVFRTDVKMKTSPGISICWEISACKEEIGIPNCVQAIGIVKNNKQALAGQAESPFGELPERYRAFEKSAEGLWMFESAEPVSVTDSPDTIIEYWKKKSYLVECNDNLARMYGFSKAEELIGVSLDQMMDFSDSQKVDNLKQFIRNDFQTTTVETKEFDRNGKAKYFLNQMTGIVENGKVKRVWGTQQDITEQRQAEQQLLESELFYRNLFANSLDGVLITDADGVVTFASPSITPILGYGTDEILVKNTF